MSESHPLVSYAAPSFSLWCTSPKQGRKLVKLEDFRGRWLILLFYPRDFSLICPTEISALSQRADEFAQRGCDLMAISTDALSTHETWINTPRAQSGLGGIQFPLGADEDGAVSRAYGVYLPIQHIALRGLFIIDPNGVLQYQVVHNLSVGRRSEEILRVLAALQTGGLCPENWTPKEAVLSVSETLGPGSVLGPYRIQERLGSGTFGTVFKAYDTTLQRLVAVKVLTASDQINSMGQLLNEARLAAALQHPNVCTIHTVDNSEGLPLIVMEWVEGTPLNQILEKGPLPPKQVLELATQIASGLNAAHQKGIVHGDVKPANLIVTANGQVKIMDFGLARRSERQAKARPASSDMEATLDPEHQANGLSGTPAYMSPEQVYGHPITAQSDIFSFGLVLFEMLTGHRAIPGQKILEVLHAIEKVNPEKLAGQVPAPYGDILEQILKPKPEDRRLTMEMIFQRLKAAREKSKEKG